MTSLTKLANRYQIGELIGSGGMAEVYIGMDERLNRQVAIKILKDQLADDPVFLARFRREAQSAASLNNPNVVAVYDSGEEEHVNESNHAAHTPYIVMEYVQGKTLREVLTAEGHLSPEDAVEVTQGILGALAYSHKMGIIHRDIKPGNIMITPTGEVKVMDFGIARAIVDAASTMTQSQGVVGTAQYLSPEQARGEQVDFRSDLYSVGCLFFELLTGRPPFVGDSPVAIAYQHVREQAPKVTDINPDVPEVFNTVVAKALAKDVDARYGDANEFLGDLDAAAKGLGVTAVMTDMDATRAFSPAEQAAINAGEETMILSPVDLGFEQAIADYNNSDESQALEEELAAEAAKKRKIIIIASIVGAVVVIGAVLFLAFSGVLSNNAAVKVKVPSIASNLDSKKACNLIEEQGLKCEVVDDKDSAEDKGKFTKQEPSAGAELAKGDTVKVYFSTGPADSEVPAKILGLSVDDAKKALKDAGFTVSQSAAKTIDCVDPTTLSSDIDKLSNEGACTQAKDRVAGSNPALSAVAKKGTTITLYVASGQAVVPDLSKKLKAEAEATLASMKLKLKLGEEIESEQTPGTIVKQTPGVGGSVANGSEVTAQLAKATEKVAIPADIVGQSVDYAKGKLQGLGFEVTVIAGDTTSDKNFDGKVQSFSPSGSAKKGEMITLKVYKYVEPAAPVTKSCTPAGPTTEEACKAAGGTWK